MAGCASGQACGCAAESSGLADRAGDCSGSESFALMVLGDSMAPEFNHGEIVIIEPDGAVADGSYVLAFVDDEWIFRQLRRVAPCATPADLKAAGGWQLQALNPAYGSRPLADLSALRGVIIQKALPGRRRASKRYV